KLVGTKRRRKEVTALSILWIILIIVLVLALLGFFSRGRCYDAALRNVGRPAHCRAAAGQARWGWWSPCLPASTACRPCPVWEAWPGLTAWRSSANGSGPSPVSTERCARERCRLHANGYGRFHSSEGSFV